MKGFAAISVHKYVTGCFLNGHIILTAITYVFFYYHYPWRLDRRIKYSFWRIKCSTSCVISTHPSSPIFLFYFHPHPQGQGLLTIRGDFRLEFNSILSFLLTQPLSGLGHVGKRGYLRRIPKIMKSQRWGRKMCARGGRGGSVHRGKGWGEWMWEGLGLRCQLVRTPGFLFKHPSAHPLSSNSEKPPDMLDTQPQNKPTRTPPHSHYSIRHTDIPIFLRSNNSVRLRDSSLRLPITLPTPTSPKLS